MAGHSKWANTKHRKARQDKKRAALFGKLSRAIFAAARNGDPNPDNNASLAAAITKAKSYSLPKANIDAAIAKASGAGADGAHWDEITYEGYGPAGVAVFVECLTDNRNRTAADVRAAFTKAGGNLGTSGSVAFQFNREGYDMIPIYPLVLEDTDAKKLMKLVDRLEELDDVQAVYHTLELTEDQQELIDEE
jgi:YebC/PmpR family DNA-binding regulatory protein